MGDSVVIEEKIKKTSKIVIDLSDSIIMEMIDSSEDLSNVRNQLIDGIILYKDTLVGLIEANELDELMREGTNIAFTASYDSDKVDEFYVMVLFAI